MNLASANLKSLADGQVQESAPSRPDRDRSPEVETAAEWSRWSARRRAHAQRTGSQQLPGPHATSTWLSFLSAPQQYRSPREADFELRRGGKSNRPRGRPQRQTAGAAGNAPHRFFSETRQDWVAAQALKVGECLRTAVYRNFVAEAEYTEYDRNHLRARTEQDAMPLSDGPSGRAQLLLIFNGI